MFYYSSPCFTNRVHVLLIGSSPCFTNESSPCFTTCPDIPLSAVQFQTYGSTSRLSCVHNGAQEKLSEILQRSIPYTKYVSHGVNLVIEHGCQESPLIAKVFDILEQLFVLFTKSTKRNNELKEKLEEVENALMLRNLSKTRWAARVESVQAIWGSLKAIVDTFVSLENSKGPDTKTKASGLLNSVHNIDFLCGLMLLKNIMLKAKMLSDYLQGETIGYCWCNGCLKYNQRRFEKDTGRR